MTSLRNKVVFITGASSGIGLSCARIFAADGAKILMAARRVDRLKKLADFQPRIKTGYLRRYAEKVSSASTGAVFTR